MPTVEHLKNAPITEAVIDFRVKLPSDFKITEFSSLKDDLRNKYPTVKERQTSESKFGIKEGKPFTSFPSKMELRGYQFISSDDKNIAQFRMDGFTFNRLKPYTNWNSVMAEAKSLWALYVEKSNPEFVTRIATRYINHLNIPLPITGLSDYLVSPPKIPHNLDESLLVTSFLNKIVIRNPKTNILVNITQALDKSLDENHVIIILDIDAFVKKSYKVDDEDMWRTFDQLRKMKNEIFFKSITNKTVSLFQ